MLGAISAPSKNGRFRAAGRKHNAARATHRHRRGGIGGLAPRFARNARREASFMSNRRCTARSCRLNLTPNAVKAFRALGIEDKIEDIGSGSNF